MIGLRRVSIVHSPFAFKERNAMLYGEKLLCLKAAKEKVPLNGILELSPLCNMNCDMCFVRLSSTEVRDLGGLRSVKEWIAVAEEMKKAMGH